MRTLRELPPSGHHAQELKGDNLEHALMAKLTRPTPLFLVETGVCL